MRAFVGCDVLCDAFDSFGLGSDLMVFGGYVAGAILDATRFGSSLNDLVGAAIESAKVLRLRNMYMDLDLPAACA